MWRWRKRRGNIEARLPQLKIDAFSYSLPTGSLRLATKLVLLVEDNHEHATLIQALLDFRSIDSSVFVTANVAEACAYLEGEWPFDNRQRHPLPGLIVLDHWLLDGTGLEILEWLQVQEELSSIPVVVFTACLDKSVEKRARELGVSDYLVKPEGYEDLAIAIEGILRPPEAEAEAEGSKAG